MGSVPQRQHNDGNEAPDDQSVNHWAANSNLDTAPVATDSIRWGAPAGAPAHADAARNPTIFGSNNGEHCAISTRPCLRRLKDDAFIPLRKSYVAICEGHHCAALLLAIFEFLTTGRIRQLMTQREKPWKNRDWRKNRWEYLGLWIFKRAADLSAELSGQYGERSIRDELKFLEKKGFLRRRQNPYDRRDRTPQFKLNRQATTEALQHYEEAKSLTGGKSAHSAQPEAAKTPSQPGRQNCRVQPAKTPPIKEHSTQKTDDQPHSHGHHQHEDREEFRTANIARPIASTNPRLQGAVPEAAVSQPLPRTSQADDEEPTPKKPAGEVGGANPRYASVREELIAVCQDRTGERPTFDVLDRVEYIVTSKGRTMGEYLGAAKERMTGQVAVLGAFLTWLARNLGSATTPVPAAQPVECCCGGRGYQFVQDAPNSQEGHYAWCTCDAGPGARREKGGGFLRGITASYMADLMRLNDLNQNPTGTTGRSPTMCANAIADPGTALPVRVG